MGEGQRNACSHSCEASVLSSELNVSKNYHVTTMSTVFVLATASPSSCLETLSSVEGLEGQEFSTRLAFDLHLKKAL